MSVRITGLGLVMLAALAVGCDRDPAEIVVHRQSCLVCHRPLDEEGTPHGIEEAHARQHVGCTDCHGGNAWVCDGDMTDTSDDPTCSGEWVYDKDRAHVAPGDGPEFLKNLSSAELDAVDLAYLRFVNPGDFRVVDETCGECHRQAARVVRRSTMAHTAGELSVARFRAGAQDDPHGIYAGMDLVDPDYDGSDACSVESLELFQPDPIGLAPEDPLATVATAQDQYMVKSCMRCHLNDFGENRFAGDFRSSGCTACHMVYADDGLSRSEDPRISKQTSPHPVRHELTRAPPIDQCTHCHYRGGRLGISFQGYRESGGAGLNPLHPEVLGEALHGHDANYYLVDEDTTNDFDETPPDVHFEAGMHCVDCHTKTEVHGNGHLYSDTQCAVTTECEDCHGSVREYATLDPARPELIQRDGRFYLLTKVSERELEVTQVKDVVTPGHPVYTELGARAMGVDGSGFSHTDDVECYTCHAGWLPSCYGCHVEVDMSRDGRYQTTGTSTPGHPVGSRRWVVLNDLVLMRNGDGKMAPSMPSERFFMTVTGDGRDPDGAQVLSKPRTFTLPDARVIAGFGQRAFNPHTTRRRSQFMACDRCHSVDSTTDPPNAALLDITHGFGSQRFPQRACDVTNADQSCNPNTDFTTYQLDAVQTRAGEPLVVVGHPDPVPSRPLSLSEIDRMRQVVVAPDEPIRTPILGDAASNPDFPAAQRIE